MTFNVFGKLLCKILNTSLFKKSLEMKFTECMINQHGRLGLLNGMKRHPDHSFDTPLLVIQTRKGSVPHLTHEVLQLAFKEDLPLLVSVSTSVTLYESVKEFGHGISEFAGLKENLTLCTLHDPATETQAGYHIMDSEPIWTPHGKELIDAEKYMDVMEAFKPDMYVALSDSDTDATSSSKRLDKSLKRSKSMFDICLRRHTTSKVLQGSELLAGVGGGYNNNIRKRMAIDVANYPVFGYSIEGLHRNSSDVDLLKPEEVQLAIKITLNELPADRLRIIPGAWHPSMILALISLGCDVFDSSLAYYSTERGSALIFPYRKDLITKYTSKENRSHEILLSDSVFKEDLSPILAKCSCLTCQKHTKAYIHHLLNTKELLASVLLMIHNLHHCIEFFKNIRRAISDGTYDELRRLVATCHSKSGL